MELATILSIITVLDTETFIGKVFCLTCKSEFPIDLILDLNVELIANTEDLKKPLCPNCKE